MEILELEKQSLKWKNLLNGLTIRLDTTEENISEFEDTAVETRKTKAHRNKNRLTRKWTMNRAFSNLWSKVKQLNMFVIRAPRRRGERARHRKIIYLKSSSKMFSKFVANINPQLQWAQWTPRNINRHTDISTL